MDTTFKLFMADIRPLGITRGSNMLIQVAGEHKFDCVLISKRSFNKLCRDGYLIVAPQDLDTTEQYPNVITCLLSLSF